MNDTAELLSVLESDACQEILTLTTREPMTAQELAAASDVPLSTVYRSLDRLTSHGLLEERTRVRPGGKDASQYEPAVRRLELRLTEDGVRVE